MLNKGIYPSSLLFLAVVLGFATACASSSSPSQLSPTPTSSIAFAEGPVPTSTPITSPTTDGSSAPPTVPQLPDVAAVVARVGPSVVSLLVERESGFASGSGVIFDAEGHILTNISKTLYTGVTNNLERRIYEHKQKLVPGFTKKYNLTMLVYFEETRDVQAAVQREKQIKGWLRSKKIDLIESKNPDWKDLSIEWFEER